MNTFSAEAIVRMWEHGALLAPVARALSLLEHAGMRQAGESLPALNIGERDGRLLALRESMFGTTLSSVTECPHCGAAIEFALDTRELQQPGHEYALLCLTIAGISLQFRQINSADLAAVAASTDVQHARRKLAELCVIEATQVGGKQVDVAQLPEEVMQALANQLAKADGQADIALDLRCPGCAGSWPANFEIAPFLWAEITVRAKQLLGEVHALAWTYGWSEADILAMSDARRQFYLGMVQ